MSEIVVNLREPHPAQAQVLAEAKRFNVLQCGRRFGKTALGVDLLVNAALDGQPVGWFAPTYKILDEAWRDIMAALRDVPRTVDKQQRRIQLCTGGSVEAWTLDHQDPARSRFYALAIIDEASVVRDLEKIWTMAVRPTLTDLKGGAWFLGTPKGRNYFHQLYVKGQVNEPGWASWRFKTVDNPFMDADEIEEARRDLPDLAFRQEYLGEAIDDAGNPFGQAAIEACLGPISTLPVASWGWDLGKAIDWTVGIGLDVHGRLAAFHRWQRSWEHTIRDIREIVGTGTRAMVDWSGLGDPIMETITNGRSNIEGFKFSAPSKQQLMEGLAAAIHQRVVGFPKVIGTHGEVLLHELQAFQYEYTRTGVRYAAPPGAHDDTVCALALAVRLHTQPRATIGASMVTF